MAAGSRLGPHRWRVVDFAPPGAIAKYHPIDQYGPPPWAVTVFDMFRARPVRLMPLAAAIGALALPTTASAGTLDALAGWWPMYEGSGQVVHDVSGNGNHGTLGSTTGVDNNDPTWINGVWFGSALRFDGNDFVRIPDSPKLAPQNLTVSAWVRGAGSPGNYRYIVGKGGEGCLRSSYGLYTAANGGLMFYTSDGQLVHASAQLSPSEIWDGRWHYVAGTWDGTSARLFLDGVNRGTDQSATGTIDYNLPVSDTGIGGYLGTCDLYYTGDIDDVALFSQPLAIDKIWSAIRLLFPKPAS